jgi:hypothetical protein
MILEQEVERIRAVRQRISKECGGDLRRLGERYQALAQQLRAGGQNRFYIDADDSRESARVKGRKRTPPTAVAK